VAEDGELVEEKEKKEDKDGEEQPDAATDSSQGGRGKESRMGA
jgi:hypothetical protein